MEDKRLFINESTITDIADSIREKIGSESKIKVTEMAELIKTIQGGGSGEIENGWSETIYSTDTDKNISSVQTGYNLVIPHLLGKKPSSFLIYLSYCPDSNNYGVWILYYSEPLNLAIFDGNGGGNQIGTLNGLSNITPTMDEKNLYIKGISSNNKMILKANYEYTIMFFGDNMSELPDAEEESF